MIPGVARLHDMGRVSSSFSCRILHHLASAVSSRAGAKVCPVVTCMALLLYVS